MPWVCLWFHRGKYLSLQKLLSVNTWHLLITTIMNFVFFLGGGEPLHLRKKSTVKAKSKAIPVTGRGGL
jgi:hypothetical protein